MQYRSQTPPAVMIMSLMSADGSTDQHPRAPLNRLTIAWAAELQPLTPAARLLIGGTGLTDGILRPPPTVAGTARSLVTIPAGFQQVSSPVGHQPPRGCWAISQRFFSQSPARLPSMAVDPSTRWPRAGTRKEVARSCSVPANCPADR